MGKLTLRWKLYGSFFLMAVLIGGVGAVGYLGISSSNQSADHVTGLANIEAEFLQREIDHLTWVKKVGEFQSDESIVTIDVQKDPTQCAFGKWYYGEERRHAEATVPGLADALRAIELPHRHLHESAQELEHLLGQGASHRTRANECFRETSNRHLADVQRGLSDARATIQRTVDEAHTEADAQSTATRNTAFAGILIGCVAAGGLGFLVARSITRPVRTMADVAEKLATGDLDQHVDYAVDDEIGSLARSFNTMIRSQKDLATAAERIARGDVSVEVGTRSDRDVLGRSIAQVRKSIQGLIGSTQDLVGAARDGRLSERADPSRFHGGYRELLSGLNDLLEAVNTPIDEAAQVLETVANRDLRERMKGSYRGDFNRIKDSLNQAVQNLDDGMHQVSVAVEQVTAASGEIGTGSQTLAQGASEQASSLEEIGSSVQEMSSMTRQSSANAQEARSLADGARTSATKGLDGMRRMTEAMERIKASSDATAKIVKTIDEIAFQTNLLALNAAVEAARAGDAGKGFAVVAEEVRNLAMRSAEAAKNTANLIEEALHNAESGVTLNREVLDQLGDIATQAGKVGDVMSEIAAASSEQESGISQVTLAVEQVNQVTQQNAAAAEESASAAEELSGQAQELSALVASFNLTAGANNRLVRPTIAASARGRQARPPDLALVRGSIPASSGRNCDATGTDGSAEGGDRHVLQSF